MTNTRSLETIVYELDARQQIHDAIVRFARGVDRCDGDLIRSAFHPDGWDDHGSFAGSVEDFIEWVLALHIGGYTWTTHVLSNEYVEFDGTRAKGETYITGTLRFVLDGHTLDLIGQGRYLDEFEERDGVWKILKRTTIVDYNRIEKVTDYSEFASAVASGGDVLVAKLVQGTRDREDPSYAHFRRTPVAGTAGSR